MNKNLIIKKGDANSIDIVKPLWEKLNLLHHDVSPYFKERFEKKTWDTRKHNILGKSKDMLFEYVEDIDKQLVIGYCISTLEKEDEKTGEIDSLFIEESYRRSGIGKELMEDAINWLVEKGAETKKICVGVGNEAVLEYYKKFGFYPLHIVLQQNETN